MKVLYVQNMRDGLIDVVDTIVRYGDQAAPRGVPTRELAPAHVVLSSPDDAVPSGIGRRGLKPAIGIAEGLQLVAEQSRPDLLIRIAPAFAGFMDGGVLHGAYGPRVRGRTREIIKLLAEDRDSRQAVLTIWDSDLDLFPYELGSQPRRPRDLPCTVSLHFWIREGRLHMQTHMRSNDAWLGLPYDVMQFTILMYSVAHALTLPVGVYHHHADSLHLYMHDLKATEMLLRICTPSDHEARYERWALHGVGHRGLSWEEIQQRAIALLDGRLPRNPTVTERKMHDALGAYT